MHPHVNCVISATVPLSVRRLSWLKSMNWEANGVKAEDRIFVSGHCPLILPYHVALIMLAKLPWGDKKIGTTGRGIGPAYEDKVARRAVHVSDLSDPELC